MRKRINELELTQAILNRLKKHEDIVELASTIVNVEVMAVGCSMVDKNLKIQDAWSLLTGYDEPVIPKYRDKTIISRLRILFSHYAGQSYWENEIENYIGIPEKYRLIDISDEGNIQFLTPRFDPNRKEDYENILLQPIQRKLNKIDYAKAGSFTYTRMKENISIQFKGVIPNSWIKKTQGLPIYREKKELYFDLQFNWLTVAEEMDLFLHNSNNEWQNRVKPIQLFSKEKSKKFLYRGVQHIVGGLASGKSTFRTISTYWLVRNKGAKVGILEGNVAQVLERVQELKRLGVNAVPIIGRGERRKHLENYLLSNRVQSVKELSSLEAISHLSDVCIIQALAGDLNKDGVKHFPCKNLYQGNDKKPKKCPLAHMCGIYKDWSQLAEADVWVTTPSAVLHSRIPLTIDPYERLLYEAMYDLLDVIFVDEADIVQKQFDEAFLEEHSAFGNPEHLVEKLSRQLNDTIQGNYDLADNSLLIQWRKNLNHLQDSVWSLYGEIKKSVTLRESLKNQVIYLNYLIFEISEAISDNEEKQGEIADSMRNFVKEATYSSVGNSDVRLHGLINVSSIKDKNNLINNWIESVGGNIPEDSQSQILYSKIEFFVYLAHIEHALKFILNFYPVIQQYLNTQVDVPLLTQIRDLRPFLKEAMTGVMLGYRYETNDGTETGQFKIIQYIAVGRQLLNEWSSLYEIIDNNRGPAVTLLSGTSYAPKSLHYHLEVEPQWYIETTRELSKLKQQFIEIRDPENGEEKISVSGVVEREKRDRNLQKIVREISGKMENELFYWQSVGEDRKILLLTNSYNDVNIVGKVLNELTLWKGRYRLLSQQDQNDEVWFPRSRVEHFAETEADILVAPILAISRGYNILDINGNGALFGSAFFLIRPYPVPNNLGYYVQILHGTLPIYFQEIEDEGLHYAKAMRRLRKRSRGHFEYMYRKPDYWSVLTGKEKTVLAWYTFIPVWQVIGRLMRGGKNARIFYCDAKFNAKGNGQRSMLEYWEKIMIENENDPIFMSLYGPFVKSIQEMSKEEVF